MHASNVSATRGAVPDGAPPSFNFGSNNARAAAECGAPLAAGPLTATCVSPAARAGAARHTKPSRANVRISDFQPVPFRLIVRHKTVAKFGCHLIFSMYHFGTNMINREVFVYQKQGQNGRLANRCFERRGISD
jgi:hypothetical protein